ncbi:MAG: AbrB/MazE/SpoVT family DNA-binding domain-containing protein [Ruminococcus sp.]|jgi:antitoxin MazE|nr:AbrB/MazE/SpoVT family DNA-binding domain-containing protein [Ruminococcus sp.]
MTATRRMRVDKWGNSLGIKFPIEFTEYAKITDKSEVEVSVIDDKIIIEKAKSYESIEELFEGFDGEYEPIEIDWGKPVGEEVW